jgi:hypothetical protein
MYNFEDDLVFLQTLQERFAKADRFITADEASYL